ncbi:radical SAM protein [Thermotomaculum hydrothermale]|uniref:Radical SAM protein n=1 Tax=Thermotomaculum hydrothermale TaxID=981385 RepID=A0A7R6PUF5_9BACT|nr:radical SAM protein [Thermotomaculum hydrothermale]BBB32877.1 radical SAM protein [Thermotomaculum hydrothermale]
MKIKIIPVFLPENQCPFRCKFCNVKVANGDVLIKSKRDIENIIEKSLITLKNRYPDSFKEVAFFGGTFTYGKLEEIEDYLKTVKPYIENSLIDGIRVSTRPDFFNIEIAEIFKFYGVTTVEFGVQSFNLNVLKAVNRGHNGEIAKKAVKISKDYGFKTSIHLMIGLPFQTDEIFLNDVKETIKLKVDYARIHPLVVLKDTKLAEEGFVAPDCDETLDTLSRGVYLLKKNNVEVIKLGLQPTDSLNKDNSVLSGCYHQSLKHLVYSKIYRDFLLNLIEKGVKEVTISEADTSFFYGYRGSNRDLIEKIALKSDNKIERESVFVNGRLIRIFEENIYG